MRSLRAELENWNYDAPTQWNPGNGDILVGTVKSYSSCEASEGVFETLTVQEEDTGALALVRLDDPELANLVKLQRPRVGDRIGFKYAGKHSDKSDNHYVLMVDRQEDSSEPTLSDTLAKEIQPPEETAGYDETTGATAEERLFIEQGLDTSVPAFDFDDTHSDVAGISGTESSFNEIIKRQDDEIHRQAEIIEKLEGMLSAAIPLIGGKTAVEAVQSTSEDTVYRVQRRPRRWIKYLLTGIALAASCGLGIAAHIIFNIP